MICKYFPSINHEMLIDLLEEIGFSNNEMWIIKKLIKEQEENEIISYEDLLQRKSDIETGKIVIDDETTKNSFYNHIKDTNESAKLKIYALPFK